MIGMLYKRKQCKQRKHSSLAVKERKPSWTSENVEARLWEVVLPVLRCG